MTAMERVEAVYLDVWMRVLRTESLGLNFALPDDRALFRLRVRAATRGLQWDGMLSIVRYLDPSITPPRSRGRSARLIADLYMARGVV